MLAAKKIVYVASPYTKGDPCINTFCQMRAFNELMDDGVVWPYIPLTSHFVHTAFPRKYEDWCAHDMAILERFDACLRLDAEVPELGYSENRSAGADAEVERFLELGKPVFYNKDSLYHWAASDAEVSAC